MRGVKVFKVIESGPFMGQKIGKGLSRVIEVQAKMTEVSLAMAAFAKATHLAYNRTAYTRSRPDHSRIKVESGSVDRFIILDDTGSELAAAAIEYGARGRNPGTHTLQKTVDAFRMLG